jgi:hypothetical protein
LRFLGSRGFVVRGSWELRARELALLLLPSVRWYLGSWIGGGRCCLWAPRGCTWAGTSWIPASWPPAGAGGAAGPLRGRLPGSARRVFVSWPRPARQVYVWLLFLMVYLS